MRIHIVQKPSIRSIDGVRLDLFEPGVQYEVGNSLAALMLAEGWAIPVALEQPASLPFSEGDPFADRPYRDNDAPPNLTREHYPPFLDESSGIAAEIERRKRFRKK
jgi:hypothetical protein